MNELTSIKTEMITVDLMQDFIIWIDKGDATTKSYINNLRSFARWLQLNDISYPERADIISYRDKLNADGLKPNTIRAYLRSVKQFFKWTAATGHYPDIAAGVSMPKAAAVHSRDALDVSEVQAVEKAIQVSGVNKVSAALSAAKDSTGRAQRADEQSRRLYAMYLLAVNAGLRTIELHRANVKDLETSADGTAYLYIWGKGHAEPDQKKALAREVYEAITDYLQSRKDHYTGSSPLFVSTGNRSAGQRIATTTISTMLKRALQSAGINSERKTAHSLRHTTGTTVYKMTGNLYSSQQYMRHANPATTEIYIHDDNVEREARTAQQLYDRYHGIQNDDVQLGDLLQQLKPEQIAQLTGIARVMTM